MHHGHFCYLMINLIFSLSDMWRPSTSLLKFDTGEFWLCFDTKSCLWKKRSWELFFIVECADNHPGASVSEDLWNPIFISEFQLAVISFSYTTSIADMRTGHILSLPPVTSETTDPWKTRRILRWWDHLQPESVATGRQSSSSDRLHLLNVT